MKNLSDDLNFSSNFQLNLSVFYSIHGAMASDLGLVHPSAQCWKKRVLDILGALVGIAITSVLFVPIAIGIRLDSPGPIFFYQDRCGLGGKTFRIWKFRTMVVEAESLKSLVENEAKGFIFKNQSDPRVTRVGAFLRRTSLDELPQFWNVLLGEMSLVGTRPPTKDEVYQYKPHHFKRLLVKPGMTGEWQVKGRSKITDFEEIVSLDLSYQKSWSILYDLGLLFQTIWIVLWGHGAY